MKNVVLYVVTGVVALLVVVGAGGGAAWLMYNKLGGPMQQVVMTTQGAKVLELPENGVLELKPFVTNLKDPGGNRYINVTFHLVMSSEKEKQKVEKNVPIVRDAVLRVLNAKNALEVTGPEGSNTLMQEIQKAVNEALGGSFVTSVLITDKVVQ